MANVYEQFLQQPQAAPGAPPPAQPSRNPYEQFLPQPGGVPAPPQSGPNPSEVPSPTAVSPPPAQAAQPVPTPPQPQNPYERYVEPAQEAPAIEVSPFKDDEPPVDPSRPWAFTKGFWTTMLEQNPTLLADFLESGARISGDPNTSPFAAVLQGASQEIRQRVPKLGEYKMSGVQFTDIKSIEDALGWAGESVGQALGSSAATVLPAIAGSALGSRIAGRTGAVVGAGAGMFGGSFAMSQGEIYAAMKEAKVPEREGAIAALPGAAFMAALDSALPSMLLAKVAGMGEIKREVARHIAKRVAVEAGKGAGVEGLTEAAQEAIKDLTVLFKTDKGWTAENWKNVLNAGMAGAVGGATLSGGVAAAQPDAVSTPLDGGERIEPTFEGSSQDTDFGGKSRGGSAAPSAPTEAPAPVEAAQPTPAPEAAPQGDTFEERFRDPLVQPSQEPQVQGTTELGKDQLWYSPMKKFVEDSKQTIATAEQWLRSMENSGAVRVEELRDTGIREWLEGQDGKVTKGDLIREMEERAITVEERVLGTGGVDTSGIPQGWNVRADTPQYENYVLPGERTGYTELLMRLPVNPLSIGNEFIAPHYGNTGTDNDPGSRNLLATLRMTERLDKDGLPVMFIDEIQSDWHQKARKVGYNTPQLQRQRELMRARHQNNRTRLFDTLRTIDNLGYDTTQQAGAALREDWSIHHDGGDPNPTARVLDSYDWGTPENRQIAEAYLNTWGEQQRAGDIRDAPPDAPFKSSWDELAVKRAIRWAIDRGYTRIAFNSAEGQRRAQGFGWTAEQFEGNRVFYNQRIPQLAKKWAKRLGGNVVISTIPSAKRGGWSIRQDDGGWLLIDPQGDIYDGYAREEDAQARADKLNDQAQNTDVLTIEFPESSIGMIQRPLPQYALDMAPATQNTKGKQVEIADTGENMVQIAEQLMPALQQLLRAFKIDSKVKLFIHEGNIRWTDPNGNVHVESPSYMGLHVAMPGPGPKTWHQIHISVQKHKNAAHMWTTLTHELGHALEKEIFDTAPAEVKESIRAAYNEYLAKIDAKNNPLMRRVIGARHNAVWALEMLSDPSIKNLRLNQMQREKYWISFEEWFAEQVARWAITSTKPLSTVDQFFHGLAKTLMKLWAKAMDIYGLPFTPAKAVSDYLDSAMTDAPWAKNMYKAHDFLTQQDNQKVMGNEEIGVPMQPETAAIRERLDKLFGGRRFWPFKVKQAVAYADKFNVVYKYFWGLHQVAQRNLHIKALQFYTEVISVAQLTKQQIMSRPHEVIKMWNKLGVKRSDRLAGFIDDVNNMVYLTPDEVKQKVARNPTPAELAVLARKHSIDAETMAVYEGIRGTFEDFLTRFEAVLIKEANKISDPVQRQERIEGIALQIAALKNKPYFPAMRFGNYTLTIRNAKGAVIHFETFERKRTRDLAAKEIQSKYNVQQKDMQLGYMADQAAPLLGMPTQLLEMMAQKLTLTQAQRDALEQLKFELSPAQSFKHRFQHKRKIAGYSMDFRRVYANYFLHGGNHLMKVMYADTLRGLAQQVRSAAKGFDVTKRHEINNYLSDHLRNWLDPKSDWMALRSLTFIWHLAWSPAAAAQNLMQTIMTTQPFLARQFGDAKATGTIMKVMGDLTSFYKRGKLETLTDFEYQALSRGIQEGVISEAMAPEMAALAEGNNLRGVAGNQIEQGLIWFNEKGAMLFELAEQFNRRVVFRSALKLAQANPNAKYVRDSVNKHILKFNELRAAGWTDEQASAYVTALDATHETQFRYGREFAPRFMRGRARAIFVFKTFITSYIIFLRQYPSAGIRSLLYLGFLGGLMAIPGAEDLKEILKVIGWQFFGRDFDIEKELRKYVIHLAGEDENGRQIADFVLHGAAKRGFGIPAAMDMLGGTVGVDIPVPTLDRSRAIAGGTLLPAEVGALLGPPVQDPGAAFLQQSQKAAGASLSPAFEMYKAIRNERLPATSLENVAKRWEHVMPRAMGSVARMYRYWSEGRERTQTGATVVRFDVRDPEQLAEILAVGAGYQPLRLSGAWNKIIAKREEAKLWDIRRQMIMRQFGNALDGGDQKDIDLSIEAIREFNKGVAGTEARGMAISSDALRKSYSMRKRQHQAAEQGTSMKKSHIPIYEAVDRLYPNYENVVKPVPGAYRPRF